MAVPEELADQLFEARDQAEAAAGEAADYGAEARTQADRAESEADRARDEADRAAQAAQLGAGAANLEAVWTLAEAVAAGESLDLPVTYFPGRNMLHLSYDGVELYRGPQYEEIGEPGADARSSAVRMRIPLVRGTVMRAWAIASNMARHVEEARAAAETAADRAGESARLAEEAARDAAVSKTVAQNAAVNAGEDAERADKAAADAEKAALVAQAAERGQGIYTVRRADCLPHCPEGFYIVDPRLIVAGTDSLPLVPVERAEDIPAADGFYLLAAVPPRVEPEEPDNPDRDPETCCGRRRSRLR